MELQNAGNTGNTGNKSDWRYPVAGGGGGISGGEGDGRISPSTFEQTSDRSGMSTIGE